jgi:hypothetical protein
LSPKIVALFNMMPYGKTKIPFSSLAALTQTAIGFGIALMLAGKLRRPVQKTAAVAVLSVGLMSTLPIVYDIVAKRINRPESERGMRKRLESIRDDHGFSQDVEVF